MGATVFVYKKENDFKVLNIENCKEKESELLKDGFKHIHTLDSAVFIQYLFNLDGDEIMSEIHEFRNPKS